MVSAKGDEACIIQAIVWSAAGAAAESYPMTIPVAAIAAPIRK